MSNPITARRRDLRNRIAPTLEGLIQGRSDCACQREHDSFMVWRPQNKLNQIHLDLNGDRLEITWPSHGGPVAIPVTFDEATGRYEGDPDRG